MPTRNTALAEAQPFPSGPKAGAPSDSFSPASLEKLTLEQLVDEFGPLDQAVRAFKPTEKKHEAYRKEIERRCESLAADAQTVLAGNQYEAQVGPRKTERWISEPARCFDIVRKLAGLDKVKELFKPLLGEIDKIVPLAHQRHFIKIERTGRRPVEAVAKASQSKAA